MTLEDAREILRTEKDTATDERWNEAMAVVAKHAAEAKK